MAKHCMDCEFIRDEAQRDDAYCDTCREDHLAWQGRDDLRRELNARWSA